MSPEALDLGAGRLARLTDVANKSVFGCLIDTGLMESGCVIVIGLDAVRERLGLQWETKRQSVWDSVERVLARKLGQGAICARISPVDYVISTGSESALCRSMALSVLRELLEFYLGAQRFEDMKIALVTGYADGEIACHALDPREVAKASAPAGSDARSARRAGEDPAFVTANGRELTLRFDCEQIINLRNGVPIATRVAAQPHDEGTGERASERWPELLSPSNLAVVNTATIDHVQALYRRSRLGVMTSCSIHALANPRNRSALIRSLEAMGRDPAKPVLFELLDIDRGTPQGRILEVVAALAPHCRKVIARVPLARPPADLLRGCRLSGLSVDCATLQEDARAFALELSAFAKQAKTIAPLVLALGLGDPMACDLAAAAGATHAGCAVPLQ